MSSSVVQEDLEKIHSAFAYTSITSKTAHQTSSDLQNNRVFSESKHWRMVRMNSLVTIILITLPNSPCTIAKVIKVDRSIAGVVSSKKLQIFCLKTLEKNRQCWKNHNLYGLQMTDREMTMQTLEVGVVNVG